MLAASKNHSHHHSVHHLLRPLMLSGTVRRHVARRIESDSPAATVTTTALRLPVAANDAVRHCPSLSDSMSPFRFEPDSPAATVTMTARRPLFPSDTVRQYFVYRIEPDSPAATVTMTALRPRRAAALRAKACRSTCHSRADLSAAAAAAAAIRAASGDGCVSSAWL